MSLDVRLTRKKWISYNAGVSFEEDEDETLYSANITHNLGEMAEKANIYSALWRPYRILPDFKSFDNYDDEYSFESSKTIYAKQIIELLEKGLKDLKKRPKYFEKFNAENGWGMYEHFVPFVEKYLDACKQYPDSVVNVSR